MKEQYKRELTDGRKIFIPMWPVDIALENLTNAGKILGTEEVINISSLNIPAVIVAIMQSEDPALASALVTHFVCQVRIDGEKIEKETINEMFEGDLKTVAELFAHVVHCQYADFFESGLAKANSQED